MSASDATRSDAQGSNRQMRCGSGCVVQMYYSAFALELDTAMSWNYSTGEYYLELEQYKEY